VNRFWISDFRFRIGRTRRQKVFCLALSGLLFTICFPAQAQHQKKVHRIGLLTTGFPESLPHLIDAFKQGLQEHGYVEGQNVLLELRYAEGQPERLPVLAAELVRLKVDVIVAIPNPAIEAVKQATQTIPIVMPIGSDPVGVSFVASLARPGANITGLSAYSPELNEKRLEIFKETIPKLSKVALLTTPNVRGNAIDLKDTEAVARSLQLRTQSLNVGSSSDLGGVFKTMIKERSDAFIVFPGQPTLFANRK
jgi:putative tryptophan/tyrosine transport system substrate-binding protein